MIPENVDDRIEQYFEDMNHERIDYVTVEVPDFDELLEAVKDMLANLEDANQHVNSETEEKYCDNEY